MKFFTELRPLKIASRYVTLMILTLLIATATYGEPEQKCPPMEDLPLCECEAPFRGIYNVYVSCFNFFTPADLISLLHELNGYSIDALEITHLTLMYLPDRLFRNLRLRFLGFSNGEILGLQSQDGNVMFEGLTDSLEELSLKRIEGINSWRWKALTSLKSLRIIDIRSSNVEAITNEFAHISPKTLREINLLDNKIGYIDKKAFADFPSLFLVDLARNAVKELQRSMFPRPANQLKLLYISRNEIKHLPDDLFVDMPRLVVVDLSHNNIQWLNYKTLLPIGKDVRRIMVTDNNIFCCSDMEEIIKSRLHEIIIGECNNPNTLKGKPIKELEESHLRHGFC